MQRLIDDANKIREANGLAGDLSIDKFSDVTQAIHEVQTNMDITGTTAEEAATTIEGSTNAMKAAWENVLAGFANPDANMGELAGQLFDSIQVAIDNVLPAVFTALENILTMLPQFAVKLLEILAQIAIKIVATINDFVRLYVI